MTAMRAGVKESGSSMACSHRAPVKLRDFIGASHEGISETLQQWGRYSESPEGQLLQPIPYDIPQAGVMVRHVFSQASFLSMISHDGFLLWAMPAAFEAKEQCLCWHILAPPTY